MGQKVNPHSFRLGVPHRGHSSLLFREEEKMNLLGVHRKKQGLSLNPSGSADRLGWDHSLHGIHRSQSKARYGSYRGFLGLIETERKEHRVHRGRLLNRTTSVRSGHQKEGSMHRNRQVEWVPFDGQKRTEEEEMALESRWKRREWKREQAWLSQGYHGLGHGDLHVSIRSINLLHRRYGSKHWTSEVQSLLRKANLTKEDERRRNQKNKRGRMTGEEKTESSSHSHSPSRRGKGLSLSVMRKLFRLAGVHPVSPLRARCVVMRREDRERDSQMKTMGDLRRRRQVCSGSKEYGLLHHEMGMGMGERAQEQALVSKGGYRGCRILVKGRLDGSRRTRKERIQLGILPLSTRSSPRSWAHETAVTKYGSIGVEVMYAY